jgi:hypothetical protein
VGFADFEGFFLHKPGMFQVALSVNGEFQGVLPFNLLDARCFIGAGKG